MTFIVVVILPLLLGLALLWLGLRGRRVSDHPMCRKCGFDLFGRPETSDRCPECGADLTRPRAILAGIRIRRGGLVLGGMALLAVAVTLAGGAGYSVYLGTDAQAKKPSWWLVREVGSQDDAVVVAAVQELARRVGAGTLGQWHIDAAADKLLARQSAPQLTWDPAFGDFLENARLANKLDDARFHQYAMQAPRFTLVVRPRVNRGDALPFSVREADARVGSRQTLRVKYKTTNSIDAIDAGNGVGGDDTLAPHGGNSTGSLIPLEPFAGKLADGRHEAKVVMDLSIYLANAPPGAQPLCWTKQVLTAPFDLLPADSPAVEIVRDESLRPAIEKSLVVTDVEFTNQNINFMVEARAMPIDVAFDVIIVADGAERHVAQFAVAAQSMNVSMAHSMSLRAPNFTGSSIDVIFRPSVAAAKGTIDVLGIWDGEIVRRGVPVQRVPPPATSPATAATRTAS